MLNRELLSHQRKQVQKQARKYARQYERAADSVDRWLFAIGLFAAALAVAKIVQLVSWLVGGA